MARDGLESIYTLNIENPYTRTLRLLAEHMFCFLIKRFIWNFKVTLLYRVFIGLFLESILAWFWDP